MHESRQRRGLTSTHKFIDRVFLSRQFIENTNQLLGYPHLENNFSFIALQSRYINYVIWFFCFFLSMLLPVYLQRQHTFLNF